MTLPVLLAAALTSGCAADAGSAYDATAREALARLDGLTGDDLIAAVMTSAAAGEADARLALGIDAALGGTADADAVLAAMRAPLDELVDRGGPQFAIVPAGANAAGAGGVGSFLGLAFTVIGMMGDNAMTLADQGSVGSDASPVPGGEMQLTIGPDGAVTSSFETSVTEGSTSAQISASSDVMPCPAVDGTLELTATSDVRIAAGTTSMRIELEVVATGRLDDSAALVDRDYTYRHQTSETSNGSGAFFDHSAGAHSELTVNRNSGGATLEFAQSAVDSAATLANMIANDLFDAAKRGWESGRCISLTLSPSEDPTSLEPGTEVTVEVEPTSVLDGRPVGGTVTASLTGSGALASDGRTQDAPGTLRYTAADERNQAGTITVESRSKRGVGRATITLETGRRAFSASGAADGLTVSGVICRLSEPFVITGGGLSFTLTPGSESGGTYRMSGSEEGVSFTGDGAYRLERGPDGVATSIVLDGDMALVTPEGSTATSPVDMSISLTPIEPCA